MSRKSFLERLGIVRKIEDENIPQLVDLDEPEETMSEEKKWIRDVLIANTEREGKVAFVIDPASMFVGRDSVEKYTSVKDLYEIHSKEADGPGTIFVVDEFADTLPETFNFEKKRKAILKLLDSAGVKVGDLITDGLSRIECLNGHLITFKKKTNDIQSECEEQIEELEGQIAEIKLVGDERLLLQDKQENAIEQEIFRIKAILDFITRKG